MSKESSSASWFNRLSPTTRIALFGGGVLTAAVALAGCESQKGGNEIPTAASTTAAVANQDTPSCTSIAFTRHANHPDEITFGIQGETTDRANFDLHEATYAISLGENRTRTIHGDPEAATYTFPGSGTYEVNASFSVDTAPNDPDVGPKDGAVYQCPQNEVTIP